jgi:hypothetical protein
VGLTLRSIAPRCRIDTARSRQGNAVALPLPATPRRCRDRSVAPSHRLARLAVIAECDDQRATPRPMRPLENPGATPKGLSFARLTTEWHAGITGRRDFAVPQILRCPSAIAPLSGPPAQNRLPRSRALTGIPAFAALAKASRSTASTALNTACRTVRVSKRRMT